MTDQKSPPRTRGEIESEIADRIASWSGVSQENRDAATDWFDEIRASVLAELRAGAEPFGFINHSWKKEYLHEDGLDVSMSSKCGDYHDTPLYFHPPIPREAELAAENAKLREYYAASEILRDVGLFRATPLQFKHMDDARAALAEAPETRG